jgi:hypothetical protein
MGRDRIGLTLAVMLFGMACSEQGTLVGVDAGESESDATESHDIVFVPQTDNDSGDGLMEWPDDAGDGGNGDDGG